MRSTFPMAAEHPGLVVIGAGGHAKVVADLVRATGLYRLVGFTDVDAARRHEMFAGASILGDDAVLAELLSLGVGVAALAIGDNRLRLAALHRLFERAFQLPALVHPAAVLGSGVQLGDATVVMAGVVVQADTKVGRAAILNTACSIDHDCRLGDAVHVAPGAHVAGSVTVGDGALLGVGSAVAPGRGVGAWATVGAGATVVRDVEAAMTVVGTPARRR